MQNKELTINIEGMSCGHCTNTVFQKISSIEGVSQTEVSLSEKNAKVVYDAEKTSRENIVEAVIGTPFQVVGIS
ncbi:MAG: heavy-metal-associated domain-containing protein [Chitinophagales bacterium]